MTRNTKMDEQRAQRAEAIGVLAVIVAALLAVAMAGCVAVEIDCTAYNARSMAKSQMTAGYGEGAAIAAVDDDQATATATRSASTVENLGMAGIGAVGGILMGGGL